MVVSDQEILETVKYLGTEQGIFTEPASSTSFACMVKVLKEGKISKGDKIVVLVTGNGLKEVESAKKAGGEVLVVDPNLDAVKETMN